MNTTSPAFQAPISRFARLALPAILLAALFFGQGLTPPVLASAQADLHGPAGSGKFGQQVTVLPNGNLVVVDPGYAAPGPIADVGAVYLYNGATGALISTLIGSTAGDQVGSGGVTVLANGSYLAVSPDWQNGAAAKAGAVTWENGITGVSGAVSAANSLVGTATNDYIGGFFGVIPLSNGNYVVRSPDWHNGGAALAGAVTWGNGAAGIQGVVSAANSLVGSTAGDYVGCADSSCSRASVTALSNGSYVVASPYWHNAAAAAAGAITPGAGEACAMGPTTGPIAAANSVRGAAAGGGSAMNFAYDPIHRQLVVGRPADNIVSLFAFSCSALTHRTFLPVTIK